MAFRITFFFWEGHGYTTHVLGVYMTALSVIITTAEFLPFAVDTLIPVGGAMPSPVSICATLLFPSVDAVPQALRFTCGSLPIGSFPMHGRGDGLYK